ncbi:hypothetical protein [Spirosoma agri]
MTHEGFIISPRSVLDCVINDDYYIALGAAVAYQIIEPTSGHIYKTVSTIERAKNVIDKYGQRWLSSSVGLVEECDL